MRVGFKSEHWTDSDGNPAGGASYGNGFAVSWQNGPLVLKEKRREPNGAFVEDLMDVCRDRLQFYQKVQGGRFQCEENRAAIEYLTQAIEVLDQRTSDRKRREVEGTHQA